MSKFIGGVVGGAIPIIVGVIATFAAPAAGSPSCMTQEEARTAFPRDHIYWHGPQRCWDNVGKQRSQTPAANGNAAGSAAKRSDVNPPPAPSAKQQSAAPPSEPAGDKPAEPVVVPPVRFVDDALLRGLSWPVPNGPANDWWARAQQAEPLPSPPPKNPAVIGAPDAAPGSPDYLLEHCCWPPPVPNGGRQTETLRHMAIGSAGAAGLAIGLWLFVYRRRQPARRRVPVRMRGHRIAVATVSRWSPAPRDRRVA